MKIVINTCWGGFNLSDKTLATLGVDYAFDVDRCDPALVALVEEDSAGAGGPHSDLKVVEIPDGIAFWIKDYDGMEHIAEYHRTWS
jgi:hypothetical protein